MSNLIFKIHNKEIRSESSGLVLGGVRMLSEQTREPLRNSTIADQNSKKTTQHGENHSYTSRDNTASSGREVMSDSSGDREQQDKKYERKQSKRTNRLLVLGCVGLAAWLFGQFLKQLETDTRVSYLYLTIAY